MALRGITPVAVDLSKTYGVSIESSTSSENGLVAWFASVCQCGLNLIKGVPLHPDLTENGLIAWFASYFYIHFYAARQFREPPSAIR